ncbi:alpha/beta-hydrolase [Ascobolus immersus RN42]|uniref:Carboxypeptidase n=1 Tax=Ascobolus immersus RN42 TaxID=1160509 RepID=A0A3N4ICH0_ASCIM|nr:alpha/beta-hydrolase [Ascobolus immersus RN42]
MSEHFKVKSLPGLNISDLPEMFAGHVPVDPNGEDNLFFWLLPSRSVVRSKKTILWLNGGPGCSSFDGALMEVGPYSLTGELSFKVNPGAWNEKANLLFVDQPVGTGFSYTEGSRYLHELDEMSTHFIAFLTGFFQSFPELEKSEIYISGESYAGQFIPYIAKAVLTRNEGRGENQAPWLLKGLLIGNGWIDPEAQYESYLPYMLEQGLLSANAGNYGALQKQLGLCRTAIQMRGNQINVPECEKVLADALELSTREARDKSCINMYDIRLRDSFPECGMNWPPTVQFLEPYLRRTDVMQAFNLNHKFSKPWVECSGAVSAAMRAKHSLPAVYLLPDLLKHMRVLLFSGDKDLICNHLGTEALIAAMEWGGSMGIDADLKPWFVDGKEAGKIQTAKNLTYTLLYNASHMVPYDKPYTSRTMLHNFIFETFEIGYEEILSDGDAVENEHPKVVNHGNGNAGTSQVYVGFVIAFILLAFILLFRQLRHRSRIVRREETDIMLERLSFDS